MLVRRAIAYLIDIIIVVFAASMLASISYLNPQLNEYEKAYDEYSEFYDDYKANMKNLKDEETIAKYKTRLEEVNYNLNKNNVYGAIISITLYIIYFAFFQKYNGGQTLGKKLTRLRVEPNLSLPKYLLRTIVLHNVWINALKVVLILTVSKSHDILLNNILSIVALVIETTILIMASTRSDNKGLHDFIVGSKVTLLPKEKREA